MNQIGTYVVNAEIIVVSAAIVAFAVQIAIVIRRFIDEDHRETYVLTSPTAHLDMTAVEMAEFFRHNRYGVGLRYNAILKDTDILSDTEGLFTYLETVRNRLVAKGRIPAWTDLWNSVVLRMKDIGERIDLFAEYQMNAEPNDVADVREAIRADAIAIVADVQRVRISLEPRLDETVKARLIGPARGAQDTLLSVETKARISAISETIETAMNALPPGAERDAAAFTLKETRGRYLPDTITAYLEAQTVDQVMADRLLDRQLTIIEESITDSLAAVNEGRLTALEVNGAFLRERLAAATEGAR